MRKQAATDFQSFQPFQFGEDALNASRKVWLASLGAAAITGDWVKTEATQKFKTLVKEGTVVESRAVSFVGDRIETSMNRANRMWKRTRSTVESTVKQAADTAVAFAQQALPIALPKVELPMLARKPAPARKRAVKAVKPVRKAAAKVAKKAKRATRKAA